MAASTPLNSAWSLNGTLAELQRASLRARIDVTRPDLGLQHIQLNGRDLPGHLLAIRRHADDGASESSWPLPLADAYIRGDDLVATYKPTKDWPYSPQLYWSANPLHAADNPLASLSLQISVETHLLDTWPRITVSSQLACQELLRVEPEAGTTETLHRKQTIRPSTRACCVLHRLAEPPISYTEVVPAGDFRELTVQHDARGAYRAEWHLFADFLEKGVIRKARLQSAFLPRENDVPIALAYCAATEQRPLPLTT
jgi:hypothetical protein